MTKRKPPDHHQEQKEKQDPHVQKGKPDADGQDNRMDAGEQESLYASGKKDGLHHMDGQDTHTGDAEQNISEVSGEQEGQVDTDGRADHADDAGLNAPDVSDNEAGLRDTDGQDTQTDDAEQNTSDVSGKQEGLHDSDEQDEQELYEHHHFVVDRGQGMLRIDKYLHARIVNSSRNKVQVAARAGNILVNGSAVKPNYKVKPFDEISIVMAYPPREIELIPEDIPLNILFEDDHLIIINKEAGMVVHPGYGNYSGTLVNALVYHFENLPRQNPEDSRPGLVHRIDKNTSGVMVVAKTELAQTRLARMFFDREINRIYHALVWGDFADEEGTIEGHIGRSLKNRKVMDVFPGGEYGKPAITHYRVLERFGYVTLVECKLETGRTHQIRAHFQHIRHPLFNDETYGGDKILKGTTFTKYKQFVANCFSMLPRHALHAKTLGFVHPISGKQLLFDTELPPDMQEVLAKWRGYVVHRGLEE